MFAQERVLLLLLPPPLRVPSHAPSSDSFGLGVGVGVVGWEGRVERRQDELIRDGGPGCSGRRAALLLTSAPGREPADPAGAAASLAEAFGG